MTARPILVLAVLLIPAVALADISGPARILRVRASLTKV